MKRIVITSMALMALPLFMMAQNVGIGTTTPSFPLDVRTSDNGTIMRLRTAKDSIGASTLLRFTTAFNLATLGDKSSYIGNLRSGAGHNLVFGTSSNNESLEERMRLNYAGFLGIGTTDPNGRLHIDMSNTTTDNAIIINDDEDAQMELQRNNTAMGFFNLTGNDVKIGTTLNNNTGNMYLRTNGIDRVMVTPSGVVRMGDLNGNYLYFFGSRIQAFNNGPVTDMNLQQNGGKLEVGAVNDAAANTKLQINSGTDAGLGDASSGYLMLGLSTGANIIADNNEIMARSNGAASPLYLQTSGGSVYIGNDPGFTSSHRLAVDGNTVITGALRVGTTVTPAGYKLAVDGRVICTEVMVRLVANWPDYVFGDAHKRMPLHELEQYIRNNKRLPGIPAAAQIEQQGLTLGEMQRLQMEKIEELTLYVIELKKEIEALKKHKP